MSGLSRLSPDDLVAIKELKARYCRTVDTKDWDEFGKLYAPGATIGPLDNGLPEEILILRSPGARGSESPPTDIETFLARARLNMAAVISVHHVHQPEIWSNATGEAEGIWAMEDLLVWPDDGFRFRGYGHYWETYRKVEDEWKIESVRLTRLYTYAERIART